MYSWNLLKGVLFVFGFCDKSPVLSTCRSLRVYPSQCGVEPFAGSLGGAPRRQGTVGILQPESQGLWVPTSSGTTFYRLTNVSRIRVGGSMDFSREPLSTGYVALATQLFFTGAHKSRKNGLVKVGCQPT